MPSSSTSTSDADYGPAISLADSADGRRDWQRSGTDVFTSSTKFMGIIMIFDDGLVTMNLHIGLF